MNSKKRELRTSGRFVRGNIGLRFYNSYCTPSWKASYIDTSKPEYFSFFIERSLNYIRSFIEFMLFMLMTK